MQGGRDRHGSPQPGDSQASTDNPRLPQRSDRDDQWQLTPGTASTRALMKWMNFTRFLVHLMRMRKTWHMLGEWLKQYTALKAPKTRSVQGSRG